MKKIVILSIAAFWMAVLAILGNGLHVLELKQPPVADKSLLGSDAGLSSKEYARNLSASGNDSGSTASLGQGSAQALPETLSFQKVAAHNSLNDCWMIITGKVYDLTAYLPYHPGGPSTMVPYCGQDATAAFQTKDKNPGKPHSQSAQDMLGKYYVGYIGQVLASANTPALLAAPEQTQTIAKSSGSPVQRASQNKTLALARKDQTQPATSIAPQAQSQTQPSTQSQALPLAPTSTSFTLEQVAAHNSQASCWMIVSSKVYDITAYLPYHPGGINAILAYCGKDGASAFFSLPHSQNAANLLASYYIGDIVSFVGLTPSPNPSPTPFPNPSTPPSAPNKPEPQKQHEEEEDDD